MILKSKKLLELILEMAVITKKKHIRLKKPYIKKKH